MALTPGEIAKRAVYLVVTVSFDVPITVHTRTRTRTRSDIHRYTLGTLVRALHYFGSEATYYFKW